MRVVTNADNELLGPLVGNGVAIGCVDEVNGPGAEEVSGYTPTHHELLLLARHWAEVDLNIRFEFALFGFTGSTEIRLLPFANLRLGRIARCLGGDAVRQVIAEVEQELAAAHPEAWKAFAGDDQIELERRADEIMGQGGNRARIDRPESF